MTVHAYPPEHEALTACCGKSLLEIHIADTFSEDPAAVTCGAEPDHPHVEQLAVYLNARDAVESGTVRWPALGEPGREAYRKDARAVLAAVYALGWRIPEGERE